MSIKDDIFKACKKAFSIEDLGVEIGILGGQKYPVDDEYGDGEFVAQVGYNNHYGVGVPARPFGNISEEQEAKAERAYTQQLRRTGDNKKALGVAGEVLMGEVRRNIVNIKTPPNSPETIERKGSSNPLIDTGVLRDSISYRVEE